MSQTEELDERELITRREAVLRVTALLGGVALVGGSAFLTGCRNSTNYGAPFTADEVAFLDEVADTILPQTSTPGAKAAKTGAFMAKMVYDSYHADDQKIFRDGMGKLDDVTKDKYNVSFMKATPQQRLMILTALDRDQRSLSQAQEDAWRKKSLAYLTDQRKEAAPGSDVGAATAATATTPTHYFRMMKELALLGYFTSEIGCTVAQRYAETPGAYNPCAPYTPGEKAWAPHA
ncbi:MAG: gluconate 2-dehydrogenase subunit 3 family protein [Gemmatimonadaceae bacterium]